MQAVEVERPEGKLVADEEISNGFRDESDGLYLLDNGRWLFVFED